ncbi:hypothetical protein [Nonomuraea sp. KM90]|uniref:hypothetical protein n=1 Tax=Nonomuraea sp. KM90 TaxID=3457428 RepID=UPI003FCE7133
MQARDADRSADTAAWEKDLADLQAFARAWFLVMHSPYWRRFIAIYTGHCEQGIVLHAADPGAMRTLMDRVAPPHWRDDLLPEVSPARPSKADVRELLAALSHTAVDDDATRARHSPAAQAGGHAMSSVWPSEAAYTRRRRPEQPRSHGPASSPSHRPPPCKQSAVDGGRQLRPLSSPPSLAACCQDAAEPEGGGLMVLR